MALTPPGDERPAVRIQFAGARPDPVIKGGQRLPGVVNVLLGDDASRWRTGIATYSALTYQGLYPGIDLRYDGRVGQIKGTYTVAPGADPAQIGWRYAGAQAVSIDQASGDLHISLPDGRTLTERAPIAWQEIGNQRVPVAARYTLNGDLAGFAIGSYDLNQPLVIDPELVYGTFLGGAWQDAGYGIALDPEGNIYVTGRTYSDDFPANGGARATDRDVFVAKFDPTGTQLLYSTLIGGRNGDDGLAIAVDTTGQAVVTVTTFSDDFPLKNALLDTLPNENGALLKLDAAGDLLFSTYLSLNMYDAHRNLGLDQAGAIYLAGQLDGHDIGIAKFSADGAQVLAERSLGGAGRDTPVALAVSPSGDVYLTGETSAYENTFPTTPGALQPVCNRESDAADASCSDDAFVLVLDSDLDTRYATYLGGVGSDKGQGIAIDQQGNIVVVGLTYSSDFPTHNAVQPECPDGRSELNETWCASYSTFVTRLTPDGTQLVFSTYVSSPDWSDDGVNDVAVASDGGIHILGRTNSLQFPVKNAPQPNLKPGICGSERQCFDAVVIGFAPDGALQYSTYLGGSRDEYSYAIAVDTSGVWVTGQTESQDFPATPGSVQPTKAMNEDVFLAKLGSASGPTEPGARMTVYLPLVQR